MKPDVLKQIKELDARRKEMENKMIEDKQKRFYDISDSLKKNTNTNTNTNIQKCDIDDDPSSQQKLLMQNGQLKELYVTSLRENKRLKEISDYLDLIYWGIKK